MKPKHDYSTKWVKIPERHTPEWNHLMGEVLKHLELGVINLALQNPNLEGIRVSDYIKQLLKTLIGNHRTGKKTIAYILSDKEDMCSTYGFGELFKHLQPFILPWIKISKAKMGKEFAYFIRGAKKTHRERNPYSHANPPLTLASGFRVLSPAFLTPKRYKDPYDRSGTIYHPKLWKNYGDTHLKELLWSSYICLGKANGITMVVTSEYDPQIYKGTYGPRPLNPKYTVTNKDIAIIPII